MNCARSLFACLAACLALPFAALATTTDFAPDKRMSDDELSQVHAAGLPDPALQRIAQGMPFALAELPVPQLNGADLNSTLDRQQALAQIRLASAATQGSLGLMQLASMPAMLTPLAPLFIPALAIPFPFLMPLPPKKEPGH